MKEFAKLDKLKFEEAVNVLRAVEVASPSATLELLIKTKLGTGITLPKGRFKLPRKPDTNKAKHEVICVFADGKQAAEAKAAGADIVGGMELVDDILSGKIKATSYLATKQFALDLAPKLGRFLGPLGLMPSERRGTAVDDLGTHIKRMGGTSEWKADKHGIVRLAFAKVNFTPEDVTRNFRYFMTNVKDATGNNKSAGHMSKKMAAKPVTKILQVRLSSTRGPSILLSDP
ncbi:ribosomal protein L1-like protein [Mycena floridula]|nr:ribosomal protein L1-like protein [Mycena floridula]